MVVCVSGRCVIFLNFLVSLCVIISLCVLLKCVVRFLIVFSMWCGVLYRIIGKGVLSVVSVLCCVVGLVGRKLMNRNWFVVKLVVE